MYELKRLQPQFDVLLPTCMYSMRNVNLAFEASDSGAGGGGSSVDCEQVRAACGSDDNHDAAIFAKRNKSNNNITTQPNTEKCALDLDILGTQIQHLVKAETTAVAIRQDKILQQLNELREQLASIRSNLNLLAVEEKSAQKTEQSKMPGNGGLREEPLHDIVINGHPNFIPYALLALKNAWKNLFNIEVNTFTHSTLQSIGAEVLEFEKQLKQIPLDPTKPKIKITLIWKNCEHTELITSPTMYVPIYGEVNIIRYLGRIGPISYRYENSPLCNEIDSVLDICYQLLRCNSAKSRISLLRSLSHRLQKQKYFGGDEMSVADIGVYSSLKRIPACTEKELTPTLLEWRKRAQSVTMI